MTTSYKTPQEEFWAGEFGTEYIKRNTYEYLLPIYTYEWAKITDKALTINSCIEFGANIGANLKAIKTLFPKIELSAVEINKKASEEYLSKFIEKDNLHNKSILDFNSDKKYDLTFTKGVLIHINPDELQTVYEKLYEYSNKYIVIAEYYNTTPVTVNYRGNQDRLFKRDFAGEFMDKYSDVKLIDYGFFYQRDNKYKDDDITWFLMEK